MNSQRSFRILCGFEDPGIRATLSEFCKELGWSSVQARTGFDTMTAAFFLAFDCIVIEQRMEDLTGVEVISAVRARGELNAVTPCLLLSKSQRIDETPRPGSLADGLTIADWPMTRTGFEAQIRDLIGSIDEGAMGK